MPRQIPKSRFVEFVNPSRRALFELATRTALIRFEPRKIRFHTLPTEPSEELVVTREGASRLLGRQIFWNRVRIIVAGTLHASMRLLPRRARDADPALAGLRRPVDAA
jgi:hypothetical protein